MKSTAKKQEFNGLDQFVLAQDSADVRFQEYLNKEVKVGDAEAQSEVNQNKRVKLSDINKSLYELPEELNVDNYTKNRDIIDRKIWVTGISEVPLNEIEKNKPDEHINQVLTSFGTGIKETVLKTQ